jgi:hypothetical protein
VPAAAGGQDISHTSKAIGNSADKQDPSARAEAIGARLVRAVADTLLVLPLERVPRTEQGKPDRGAIGPAAGQFPVGSGIWNPPFSNCSRTNLKRSYCESVIGPL